MYWNCSLNCISNSLSIYHLRRCRYGEKSKFGVGFPGLSRIHFSRYFLLSCFYYFLELLYILACESGRKSLDSLVTKGGSDSGVWQKIAVGRWMISGNTVINKERMVARKWIRLKNINIFVWKFTFIKTFIYSIKEGNQEGKS